MNTGRDVWRSCYAHVRRRRHLIAECLQHFWGLQESNIFCLHHSYAVVGFPLDL